MLVQGLKNFKVAQNYHCLCCAARIICPSPWILIYFTTSLSATEWVGYFSSFLPCLSLSASALLSCHHSHHRFVFLSSPLHICSPAGPPCHVPPSAYCPPVSFELTQPSQVCKHWACCKLCILGFSAWFQSCACLSAFSLAAIFSLTWGFPIPLPSSSPWKLSAERPFPWATFMLEAAAGIAIHLVHTIQPLPLSSFPRYCSVWPVL